MSQSSALYIIDIGSLRLIKDQLEEHVSYGLINLTIAILKIKTSYVSSSSSPSQTLPTHSQTQQPHTIDSTSSTQTQVSHTIMTIYTLSCVSFHIGGQGKKRKQPYQFTRHSGYNKKSKANKTGQFW